MIHKNISSVGCLGLLCLMGVLVSVHADPLAVSTTPEGISINAGVVGIYTLEAPGLMTKADDYNPPKPAVTVVDGSQEVIKYPNGAEINVKITGTKINYSFKGVPADAYGFRFRMIIPIRFSQGGKFAFDGRPEVAFPANKDKQFLVQDNGTKLQLQDPSGSAFSVQTPRGFHEVCDNRFFNWPVFAHIYTYNIQEHAGETSIEISLEDNSAGGATSSSTASASSSGNSTNAPALSTSGEGISINAGVAGIYTLEAPGLMTKADDYNPPKPAVTVMDGSQEVIKYPNGAEIGVKITGTKINYSFKGVPADAYGFRFRMIIPIRFSQGGKFAFDGRPEVAFPANKDKQFLVQDNGTKLQLQDPSGSAFSVQTPRGFHEVCDNRFFNWPVFAHIYTYNIQEHAGETSIEISVEGAASSSASTGSTKKFVVNKFGQFAAKEFPGKVTSEDELKQDIAKDKAWLADLKEPSRDGWGGLMGSSEKYKLKKTGFFRLDRVNNRQVLVDPDGNIFYQLGVCCFQPDDHTLVRGREKIYEWLPPNDGTFSTAGMKHDPTGVISFYIANWIRKFGQPLDFEKWSGQQIERMRKWGFNSAGSWSAFTKTMETQKFPTTPVLPLNPWDAPGLVMMQGVDRMYDPFAPGCEEIIEKALAKHVAPQANNPNIIGYFIENEQLFENIPRIVPAQKSDSPSKKRLVQMLKEKYSGNIAKFNTAWAPKTVFTKFDELYDTPLFVTTSEAAADMKEFLQLYLETHYSTVARIFRKNDPNHLLLGSRWQPGTANNELLVKIASKYVDVISVNYYVYAIESSFLKRIYDWSGGKPILLSEWHYTSTDQGLGGQKEVANQKERGLAYRNYVETTAAIPYIIGQQWFAYIDQSVTGRWFEGFNGEAANTGLINVVDRPYTDFILECKKTNDDIYKVVMGEKAPFHFDDPRFTSRSSGATKALSIPRALPGLKVDGTTQNWPGRPPESITAKNLTLGTPDPDFSASFRVCWDDQFLYIIAEVKDKTPLVNTQTKENLWQGDCLEIFLADEKISEGGELLPTDVHVMLGASAEPKVFVRNSVAKADGVKVVASKNILGGGYTIEAALPWDLLKIKPANGKELLFDVGIDNTDDGKLRTRQWIWNGTERNSTDRGAWGRAKLMMN